MLEQFSGLQLFIQKTARHRRIWSLGILALVSGATLAFPPRAAGLPIPLSPWSYEGAKAEIKTTGVQTSTATATSVATQMKSDSRIAGKVMRKPAGPKAVNDGKTAAAKAGVR